MRRRVWGVFLALAALFASSCGATRPSKYYQLEVARDLRPANDGDRFPVTLILSRLKASHLYRQDRIVYSGSGEEIGTYEFHRWTEPPGEMVEKSLLRELRASGHYRGVYSLSSSARGDFLLRGELVDFKEVSAGTHLVRVTLDLELSEAKSGDVVWTHYYTHDEPVNGRDISAVVAALNRNVQRGVGEARVSLDEHFKSHSER